MAEEGYPHIKAMAREVGADIYFGDAAHMRSDHHAGRTWGRKVKRRLSRRRRPSRDEFDIGDHFARPHAVHAYREGRRQRRCVIEFLKRLAIGAKRAIFLIVDRGPAHIAKKTRAFVESLNGALRLFYLPPYSPDRNPDELVWKHLKADTVGRMT